MRKRVKSALKKDVVKSASRGVGALLLITLILTLCKPARADFTPYVYLGLETDVNHSLICKPGSVNDLAANLGFGATLKTWDIHGVPLDLDVRYTHHSCAFDTDWDTYDGAGVMLRWYPWGR